MAPQRETTAKLGKLNWVAWKGGMGGGWKKVDPDRFSSGGEAGDSAPRPGFSGKRYRVAALLESVKSGVGAE
jgi:hypothetical protein